MTKFYDGKKVIISIYASRGGSDYYQSPLRLCCPISIHASRGGSDDVGAVDHELAANFNPRFPRGKRRSVTTNTQGFLRISIHASRGGSDIPQVGISFSGRPISIHASRGGSDQALTLRLSRREEFQSTLPAGEATEYSQKISDVETISIHASRGGSDCPPGRILYGICNFNPRFPRGKRLIKFFFCFIGNSISIHASRGGSDIDCLMVVLCYLKFQSTLPAGEATVSRLDNAVRTVYFNPRFPRGKRQTPFPAPCPYFQISIHASRGGSDHTGIYKGHTPVISIHASRGGSDESEKLFNTSFHVFQSTLPAGEATVRSSCPLMTAQAGMVSANRDF